MEDYTAVVRQMNLLRQCGVHIAMDDFGTGYSSLSYIHRIPVDVLKIDRSFIEKLSEPEGTRPIVEAVIAMAKHLGLHVVAEGVSRADRTTKHFAQGGMPGIPGISVRATAFGRRSRELPEVKPHPALRRRASAEIGRRACGRLNPCAALLPIGRTDSSPAAECRGPLPYRRSSEVRARVPALACSWPESLCKITRVDLRRPIPRRANLLPSE